MGANICSFLLRWRDFPARYEKKGWNFLLIIPVVVAGLWWLGGGPFR